MNNEKLVTVVIPAYNAEEFIEDAVKSCFSQTHNSVETIVVNDASTDATADIVNSLADSLVSSNFRLRLIDVGKNKGAANALNMGFSEAEGDYICWLSADDIFSDKDKVKKQVGSMKATSAGWSYFRDFYAGSTISSATLVKGSYLPRIRVLDPLFTGDSDLRLMALLFRNPINGSSIMIRREVAVTLGQFDPVTKNVDLDGDLWMRYSALNLKLVALSGAPVFYREHRKQTSKKKSEMLMGSELTRVRTLMALEKRGRITELIKRFVLFFPTILQTGSYLNRPFTSEFLFNYILNHEEQFCFIFKQYIAHFLGALEKHIESLSLDRDEFRKQLELYKNSPVFKDFERTLSRLSCVTENNKR